MRGRTRVVITGGAGFIGTNVADRFARSGARVLVYDDLSRKGVEENLRWLVRTHGDRIDVETSSVTDVRRLRAALSGATAVFHFAAQVAVTTSIADPAEDFAVNLRGTLNLLEALRSMDQPPPLLFTSTNKVYGALPDVALTEDGERYRPVVERHAAGISERRPLDFHSPYGCSKGGADQYVLDYSRTYGLPSTVFRMSCIYGPHQHGNEDQGWVAHFLIRALKGEPITIYGDGKQVRDVLFVSDLVDACEAFLAAGERVWGRPFNVGGGPANAVSLRELLARIGALCGGTPEYRNGDWRPGDQRWYVSDTRAFGHVTGWRPRVSVDSGVRMLHEWLREDARRPIRLTQTAAAIL